RQRAPCAKPSSDAQRRGKGLGEAALHASERKKESPTHPTLLLPGELEGEGARPLQSRCAAFLSRPAPNFLSSDPNSFLNTRESLPRWVLRSFSSSLVSQAT